VEQVFDAGRREGLREAEALDLVASELDEPPDLVVVLHAFGDDVEFQRAREPDERVHDPRGLGTPSDAVDERLVDLERVHREALQ